MDSQVISPEIIEVQPVQELAQTRAKHVVRDENGKWLPGHCPNPNGRPKAVRIRDAFEGILHDEGAEKYAAVVTDIALSDKQRAADRLAAVTIIADRTEGKPVQAMLVGHVIDESSVRTIAELLSKLHIPPQLEQENE